MEITTHIYNDSYYVCLADLVWAPRLPVSHFMSPHNAGANPPQINFMGGLKLPVKLGGEGGDLDNEAISRGV